ncbi:MAG: glycosyltransferase [Lachnospiraceae bacterium]|nr:glycosyltransferase [Lachnospiraceae bacterium]
MKVLILSCNTGGGHNAAAQAIAEAIREHGDCAEVLDYLCLAGNGVSKLVGDGYVEVVKKAPAVFGMAYKLGMAVSKMMKKSPVYYANARMARYLEEYLQKNPVDAIVMPHLYPAETITYMRRNGVVLPFTVVVMTDYTCIPFWEETDCDYYITPHKKLHPEIVKRGIPEYKLKAFGIPVSGKCRKYIPKEQARSMLGLEQKKKYFLLAAGSMGTKAIVHILELLLAMRSKNENLVVICGSNQKLKKKLQKKYKNRKEVMVVGYTKKMPIYLKACDVIFTKPGGLTSTEAAVSGIPIVHIRPIPGCETENRRFFQKSGMSVSRKTAIGQVVSGVRLMHDEKKVKRMLEAQKREINPDASEELYCFLKENTKKLHK